MESTHEGRGEEEVLFLLLRLSQFFPLQLCRRQMIHIVLTIISSTYSGLCGTDTASPIPDWHLCFFLGFILVAHRSGEALLFSSSTGFKGLVAGLVKPHTASLPPLFS